MEETGIWGEHVWNKRLEDGSVETFTSDDDDHFREEGPELWYYHDTTLEMLKEDFKSLEGEPEDMDEAMEGEEAGED